MPDNNHRYSLEELFGLSTPNTDVDTPAPIGTREAPLTSAAPIFDVMENTAAKPAAGALPKLPETPISGALEYDERAGRAAVSQGLANLQQDIKAPTLKPVAVNPTLSKTDNPLEEMLRGAFDMRKYVKEHLDEDAAEEDKAREDAFRKALESRTAKREFLSEEDIEPYKVSWPLDSGEQLVEYQIGGDTLPEEVAHKYLTSYNDELLHEKRFRDDEEYRNNWFLQHIGITDKQYRENLADELDKELDKWEEQVKPTVVQNTRGGYAALGAAANQQQNSSYQIARKKLDDARAKVNTLRKNNFWSGLREGADLASLLTFDLSSIGDNLKLMKALDKEMNGEPLTKNEEALIKAWEIDQKTEEAVEMLGGRSWPANVGYGVGYSLPYIPQLMLTGGVASAATKGISSAVAKAALKKSLATTTNRKIAEGLKLGALKVAENTVGSAARTPFMGMTYKDFTNRRLEHYSLERIVDGATGEVKQHISKEDSSALRDAFLSYGTTMSGVFSEGVGDWLSYGIKAAAKSLPRKKILRALAVDGISGPVKNPTMVWLKRASKINGVLVEIAEEAIDDITTNVIAGDEDGWKRMATGQYWWELFCVSAILSGSFGAAYHGTNLFSTERKSRRALEKARLYSLDGIRDESLRKYLFKASMLDDLTERSKMLANIDWESGYTREDMARSVDFITAQTSLDAMYYSEAEADRLRRMMPALAKIDRAANDKELNTDDLAEILGDTYAKAFRTQENQQDLNRIADRVRVAANAGISARDINDILAQAGLKVYAPGDEVETLAGVHGMVNNVLPGAYEIIDGNGNIGVFSFEEVLQPSKEVAEAQMANAGQEVAAEEQAQNAQPDATQQAVAEAVEAARVEAESIKNLDDDVVYDATMTDGTPVHIIKGSNIIYNEENGKIDYEASDKTVVVRFKDGSRKQVSTREIFGIDDAIAVDEMVNLAGEAALAAAEAAQAQEAATEAQPIVEQTAVEGERQAVQAPEQTNVQPGQVAEQTVAPKPAIPTLKNGQPDYNAMTPEQFVDVFGAQHGENAVVQIANNNVKAAEKKIADIEKKQSSLTDPNDFAKNASQLEEAKALKAKYEKVLEIVSQRNAAPQVAEETAQTAEQTVEPTEVAEAVEAIETPTAEVEQTAPTQEEVETEEPTAEVVEEVASTEEPTATVEEGSRFEGITAEEQALFDKMAKALNVAVEYVDEVNGGRANAEYIPSTRTLRVARGGRDKVARFLVGHEFTHRMQALAPQQYEEFAQAVVDYLGAEFNIRVKRLREVYKAHEIKANTQLLRDEVVADFAGELAENALLFDGFVNTDAVKNNPGLLERIMEVLRAIRDYFVENNASNPALDEAIGKLEALYSASVEAANSIESEGGQVDIEKGDALSSVKDILQGKQREKAIKDLMRVTGRSRATVERYLKAEESLAAIILDASNNHILDLPADDSLPSIWKNSDYPQGTVEFSNICRKRLPLTMLYQRLQKEFPLMVFDKYAIETMRGVLKANGVDVACGICFVEDRRQLLGEIGQMFIDMLEGNFIEANEKQDAAFEEMKASWDGYIPTLYDLLTLDGYKALKAKHPAVATAFLKFNNARGMQAGRLFQAYSAYHREILGYSKATVRSKNNNGGLRIFSFSDFEAHHLIDLVQILTDCAAKGLKVQGYTKVPEFARAVKDTNMKVNRSLISKGNGVVDANYVPGENEAVSPNAIGGKRLLLDTVEGIDVNHRDFFDSTDSKSVGNILVGINEEQIRLAMLDPFVDYIIPFHTGLSASVLKQKGIGEWVNYKNSQIEKVEVDGKLKNAPGHGINIYEEVLSDDIKTERQFVNRYLEVCREKGYIPKFPQFLSKNSKGEYIYTKGYYKFLIDFKLFDKNGKIIPQEAIVPVFDNELNKQILEDYVRDEKAKLPNEELYGKVKEALDLPRYSVKDAPMFYSNAFNAVKAINQEKATPEQWLKMIEKSGGLKAGEDRWLRLSDWLKDSEKKTLTKQEVLDYINENQIQIEEVKYSEFGPGLIDEATRKLESEMRRIGIEAMRDKYPDFDDYFEVLDGELVWSENNASEGEYEDYIIENKIVDVDPSQQGINERRLSYTTQGLTNKREIALTVPTIEPWNGGDQIHFGDAGEGRAIAWIRFGDTTDEYGFRVLVIDEIQSKRHQEGRERGYATDVTEEQVKKAREEADVAYRMFESFDEQMAQKYGTRFWSDQGTNEEYAHWELLRSEYDRYGRIYEELYDKRSKAIPAAPFEKNWHELAIKRMLRYAAENGYDAIAWTKGDQQAERYNIGSVVQRITSYEDGDNRMVIIRLNNNEPLNLKVDSEGEIVSSNREIGANTLSDVVGKELAVKIMNNEGEDATYYDGRDIPAKVIAGDGLRIGGEGMRGFYDQILPSFINKYGKKWGVKVQDITLPFVEEAGRTMHSVDVTDAMRESVMEGQPLFSVKQTPRASFLENISDEMIKSYVERQMDLIDKMNSKDLGNYAQRTNKRVMRTEDQVKRSRTDLDRAWNEERLRGYKAVEAYARMVLAAKFADHEAHADNIKRGKYDLDFAKAIFEKYNKSEENAKLFDYIYPFAEKIGLTIKITSFAKVEQYGEHMAGRVSYDQHFLNSDIASDAMKAQIILHELIHSVTANALNLVESPSWQEAFGIRPNEELVAAATNLKKVLRSISADKEFEGEYGLKDAHEMLAELANPQFVDKLKKHNLWTEIVNAIKRVVSALMPDSIYASSNAHKEVMDALEKIIENTPAGFNRAVKRVVWANKQMFEANDAKQAFWISPEVDAKYLEAVESGNMEEAQKMVNAAANAAGYSADESWKKSHRAPHNSEDDVNPFNTEELVPEDYWAHPEWYTQIRHNQTDRESYYNMFPAISKYKRLVAEGKQEEADKVTVTMYRGVDKAANKRESKFRNGDWITPSRSYALLSAPYGRARVIEQEVPLKNIWWDGNSINEWGYDDGAKYTYKDTKNNRKLLDAVTYDDSGNVIPLSKRFNSRVADIRYSIKDSSAERAEIERVAKANGTWLKAPNGKPTNLTPEQWVTVRTKAFKKWFGDWELGNQEVKVVPIVNRHPFDVSKKVQLTKRDAVKYAKSIGVLKTMSNEDTNGKGEVIIAPKAIRKIVDDAYGSRPTIDIMLDAIAQLPMLIKESLLIEEHFSYNKGADGVRRPENGINPKESILRCYGAIEKDGKIYRTKITIKRDNGNHQQRAYTYEVMEIELTSGNTNSKNKDIPTLDNSISLAKLLKLVENDKKNGEKLLDSSKIIDENGEPKIVWHGGDFAIDNFVPYGEMHFGTFDAAKDRLDSKLVGSEGVVVEENSNGEYEWMYVDYYDAEYDKKGDKAFATKGEAYRDAFSHLAFELKPYFLNIRSVERVSDQNTDWDGVIAEAKAKNHDGLAYENQHEDAGSESYIAFYPNQIKSAEGNATFDPNDDDTRFSVKSNVETEESADIEVGENIDAGPSQSIIESEKAQKALTRLNKVVRQFRAKLNKVAKENLDWGTSVATALEKEVGSGELLSFLEMADFISNIRGAISEKSVDKALETLSDKVLTKLIAERKKNLKQLMEVEVQRTTPAGIPIAHGVDNATRQVVDTFNILKKLGPEQARKHMEEISDKDMPGHLKAEVMQLHTLWMLIQDEETNLEVLKQKLDRAHEESVAWYRTARALKGVKGREKEREEALAMRRTHIAEIRRIEPLMTATKQQLADDYASIVEQFADRIMVGRAAQKRKIDEERKYAQRFGIEALKDVDTGRDRKTYEYSAEEKMEKKKDQRLRDIRLSMHGSLKYMIESVSTNAIGGRGFIYHEMILGDNGWVACRDNELQMNIDCNLEILKRANAAGFKTVDDMRRAFDDRLLLHDGTQAVVTYMTERTGAQKVEKVPLTVGNATYLVLMYNQPDIRPTIERMNIDEETIMELHEMLPAYAKNFIEWSVDMLEERLEKVYSPASVQMYGTSMDKNLNYFPVRRVKEDTYHAPVDITDPNVAPDDNKKVVNTSTALIRRKANLVSVQILVNPMEVLGKHLEEMNHFATFVPFTRNANILLSAPGFREQLDMQEGTGHGLNTYDNFKQAVLVAAGNYQPATDKISKVLNEVQGLVAAGKIAWRYFTAAKQILSLPAFASYSTDPKYWKIFTKNILTTAWWKRGESGRMSTWKWCYENLPTYKQRWDSKYAGDEKLSTVEATAMARALDRSMAGRAIKDFFGKYGMLANAAVDAFTCSIGAYSIYEYELQRYQNEEGMSKEEADKMAKRRAEIGFNQSQQSSELLFLAPSQLDKTFAATYASLFENSNRAYGRIERVAREQIVRSFNKEAVAKQLDLAKNRYAKKLRDAERARLKAENEKISDFSKRLTEEQIEKAVNEKRAAFDIQAEKMAKRDMSRAKKNAVADVVVFRYLLNILWSISPSLAQSVAFIGSDDDENPESWDWAFWANNILQAHLRNGVGGATIGSLLSGFGVQSMLEADLNKLIDTAWGVVVKIDKDGEEKTTIDRQAFWETAKLVYAMGTGINLETFGNMYNAVCMVINDGSLDAEDVALFLNSPKSIIEAAAIRPDEGESQEDYIKRIAFMKGLASKVETAQKKQEMNSEGIVEELTDAEKSALTNLKKWQKNYIDIKTARALGLQWQRNRYNGRVEIPELKKLDKQYKDMLKMLGRTPSLNKVEKEKRYIYPEDVQSRIDEAVERLDVMKRLRNIRGLEQGRELNVVKNSDYEALTRQWYDAKKSLVEDWKNYQIK